MSAFVIGQLTVTDAGKWAEYRARVGATIEPWGGEVVLRGRRTSVFCGEHGATEAVVIRFPSPGAAAGWYASASYQALIPLRDQAADITLVGYD